MKKMMICFYYVLLKIHEFFKTHYYYNCYRFLRMPFHLFW